MKDFICEVCNKSFKIYSYQRRGKHITCSLNCYNQIRHLIRKGKKAPWINKEEVSKRLPHFTGVKSSHWKGGRYKHPRGYILVYAPDHKFATDKYVFEHRLVMEKHIGRYLLPHEKIHHLDGDKTNNKIDNLVVTNLSEHMIKYHNKLHNSKGQFIS